MKIPTASDLKHAVEQSRQSPHFFARETMRFFGDTMKNYGLRQPREVETVSGQKAVAYELTRRHPVKMGNQKSAWFDSSTFALVFPKEEMALTGFNASGIPVYTLQIV